MKSSNNMWMTVVVSVVTSVVVFFALFLIVGNPLLGPDTRASIINADDCSRDPLCSMKSSQTIGNALVGNDPGWDLDSEGGNLYVQDHAYVGRGIHAMSGRFQDYLTVGQESSAITIDDGRICFGEDCKFDWSDNYMQSCSFQATGTPGYRICRCTYGDVPTGWVGSGCEKISNDIRGCVRTTHTAIADPEAAGIQFYTDGASDFSVTLYCSEN